MPQPNFVPVMPSTSRNTQSSGVSSSTSTLCVLPLTLMVKAMASSPFHQLVIECTPGAHRSVKAETALHEAVGGLN
jgi:hypothetical protein